MAINASGLIFAVLPLWWVFEDLLGDEFVVGNELGDDDTMVGLVFGINGDAMAPSDPGLVGLLTMSLQVCIGDPQRAVFGAKADNG